MDHPLHIRNTWKAKIDNHATRPKSVGEWKTESIGFIVLAQRTPSAAIPFYSHTKARSNTIRTTCTKKKGDGGSLLPPYLFLESCFNQSDRATLWPPIKVARPSSKTSIPLQRIFILRLRGESKWNVSRQCNWKGSVLCSTAVDSLSIAAAHLVEFFYLIIISRFAMITKHVIWVILKGSTEMSSNQNS